MKVVSSADWRRSIPFDSPMLVSELVPGEATRCFTCGLDSAPRERTELWAYKHRHPIHHDGYVRFYCVAHVPEVPKAAPAPATTGRSSRAAVPRDRVPVRRGPSVDEKPRAMCTDCFVEVSATGICGMCGKVA
ncbi:MAG: glucose-6-phosphate dehydrogenase [Microbacterium sp.]